MNEAESVSSDAGASTTFEPGVYISGVAQTRDNFNNRIIKSAVKSQAVVDAFANVDRKDFVPDDFKMLAYSDDGAIPLGEHSSISQASLIAEMIEQLDLSRSATVLEIGTASGYTAAVLSQLATRVETIEYDKELADQAKQRLVSLGYLNVNVHFGDGAQGLAENAPFDAIIITAAVKEFPYQLEKQLAEGGRIIAPVGMDINETYLTVATKTKGRLIRKKIRQVFFLPLISKFHGGWDSLEEFNQASMPQVIGKE